MTWLLNEVSAVDLVESEELSSRKQLKLNYLKLPLNGKFFNVLEELTNSTQVT